jgi:hypothetical protein
LNTYEIKISNAFKKAEIREKVFQESLLSKKHDSKIKTIFDKIMTEVSEKKLVQKDISKLILTQNEKLGESIGHKLTEDESKYFYKLIGEYTKEYQKQIELYNLLYSNKNSINSQGSTNNQSQQQAQSKADPCSRCYGDGNCHECVKTFSKPYHKGNGMYNWQNETKAGYTMCNSCNGRGHQQKSNPSGYGWVPSADCPRYGCEDGWVICGKCNTDGRGTLLGKCRDCHGTGKDD